MQTVRELNHVDLRQWLKSRLTPQQSAVVLPLLENQQTLGSVFLTNTSNHWTKAPFNLEADIGDFLESLARAELALEEKELESQRYQRDYENTSRNSVFYMAVIFFGVVSLLFTLICNFSCHYAMTSFKIAYANDCTEKSVLVYHGIWNYKQLPRVITFTTVGELDSFYDSTASCIGYSDGSLLPDLKWRAARGFSVSAVVFGSLGLLSVIYALNRLHSGVLNRPHLGCLCFFFTGLFSLTLFFQALTFIFLGSNGCKKFPEIDFLGHAIISASQKGTCQRAPTANLGIAACVLWFVCALTSAYICLKAQPVP